MNSVRRAAVKRRAAASIGGEVGLPTRCGHRSVETERLGADCKDKFILCLPSALQTASRGNIALGRGQREVRTVFGRDPGYGFSIPGFAGL